MLGYNQDIVEKVLIEEARENGQRYPLPRKRRDRQGVERTYRRDHK
jgi:hypothetical protein